MGDDDEIGYGRWSVYGGGRGYGDWEAYGRAQLGGGGDGYRGGYGLGYIRGDGRGDGDCADGLDRDGISPAEKRHQKP